MKRKVLTPVLIIICAVMLSACGAGSSAEVSTIMLLKNGKITEVSIEDFSASYYDEEELLSYIDETVEEFTEENGKKSVSVSVSKVEDDTAYLTITYSDCDIYSAFSGEECFSGDIIEAQTAGYDFDTEFYQVEDGEVLPETVGSDTVLSDDSLNVFIVRTNEAIQVPGDIVYVSADMTSVESSDTVLADTSQEDEDEMVLVYVIYE